MTNVKAPESGLRQNFYFLGSMVFLTAVLYWGRPVLIPVTIAVLATFVLSPIVARLEGWGTPRFIACAIAVLGAAVLLVAIGYIFVLEANSLASKLPEYKIQVAEKITNLQQATSKSWVADVVDFANEIVNEVAGPEDGMKARPAFADVEIRLMPIIQSIAGMALEILVNAVIVAVLALLILMRREDLRNRVIHSLGTDNLVSTTRLMDDASQRISRFLLFQLIINLGFGVVIAGGLYLIGIPYTYVWGALAALLRYIPFVGGWIAAAFPLLASLVMPHWTPFFLTGSLFVVAELLQANLVEPLVFGRSIGVSGAGQLVALLFWTCLWGPIDLILSTPLTACLCVMGRHFPVLGFFSNLLGEQETVEKPAAFYQRLLAGDLTEATNLAEEFVKTHPVEEIYDELFIPALLSAQSDLNAGELTKEDQLTIIEAIEEIFLDVAAPLEKHHGPVGDRASGESSLVCVLRLPFNDAVDDVVVAMLKRATAPGQESWSLATFKNGQLDGLLPSKDTDPGVILLATSVSKNVPGLRGACKAVRELFPEAKVLVACWSLQNINGTVASRLKDAGAAAICANFLETRHFIDTEISAHLEPISQLAS
jgi:predicted PurR-regulated permease PerM